MRINGTTKSTVASTLAEAISGATTIRAFGKEDQYFSNAVKLINNNASPFFHSFSSNEWLIQRLEMLCAVILSCSALALTLLPFSKDNSGWNLPQSLPKLFSSLVSNYMHFLSSEGSDETCYQGSIGNNIFVITNTGQVA